MQLVISSGSEPDETCNLQCHCIPVSTSKTRVTSIESLIVCHTHRVLHLQKADISDTQKPR